LTEIEIDIIALMMMQEAGEAGNGRSSCCFLLSCLSAYRLRVGVGWLMALLLLGFTYIKPSLRFRPLCAL